MLKLKCDECEILVGNPGALKNHQESMHISNVQILEDSGLLQCKDCDYKSLQMGNLKRHTLFKHIGIKLKCEDCFKTFGSHSALKSHKDSIHGGISYGCNICEFHTAQPAALKSHKKKRHALF